MTKGYLLHYAPDNASLIVRLVLDEMNVPFETTLVDRRTDAQRSAAYLALNPNGLIPVLETPDGPVFETGAILLWLADRHHQMAPAPDHPLRGAFLKWLFFISNTLHADLRINFYTHLYAGPDSQAQHAVRSQIQARLVTHLSHLEQLCNDRSGLLSNSDPTVLDYYIACCMRWMALYPAGQDCSWFSIIDTPALHDALRRLEDRRPVRNAQSAEGLGETPFTNPRHPQPPEGSAT